MDVRQTCTGVEKKTTTPPPHPTPGAMLSGLHILTLCRRRAETPQPANENTEPSEARGHSEGTSRGEGHRSGKLPVCVVRSVTFCPPPAPAAPGTIIQRQRELKWLESPLQDSRLQGFKFNSYASFPFFFFFLNRVVLLVLGV